MTIRPSPLLLLVLGLFLSTGCPSGDPNIKDDTAGPTAVDADGDGFTTDEDCDDDNAEVYPGAEEECDELDNDCDGEVDEGTDETFYGDVDGDGYGDPDLPVSSCEAPSGYVDNADDCDDSDAMQHPGADEYCNGEDDDCDGEIDEDAVDTLTWYQDVDGDGHAGDAVTVTGCDQPDGYYAKPTDCDDEDAAQNPDAKESCNGEDDDCDGDIDEDGNDMSVWYQDSDGDGYGNFLETVLACDQPKGYVADNTDCDDYDADQYPGADEWCNGEDDDCDGIVDEDDALDSSVWYADSDGDGFGDPLSTDVDCYQPKGYVADDTDCDDTDNTQFPGAPERCNGEDDDCDGFVDEDDAVDVATWYADTDGDGYGDPTSTDIDCTQPTGFVADNTDCDDTDNTQFPGATERCNGEDDDCDGDIDEDDAVDVGIWYRDDDGDGYGDASISEVDCDQPSGYVADNTDCDDTDNTQFPGAPERCNGEDDDCDGIVDEDDAVDVATWYQDADSDGYGDAAIADIDCDQPSGYVADDTDCDDADPDQHPGADERCNGEDDDCDGDIDEDDAVDVATWYADSDGDGYGDASTTDIDCEEPKGYVADATDCDDTSADVNPAADEECNGIDDDCDGSVDEDDAVDVSTWYADSDGDSYGDASSTDIDCNQPSGYVADSSDCDDTDATQYPGADEWCNGEDDDCDGTVDEDGGVVDGDTYYLDADGDGTGDASNSVVACDAPTGYVDNDWDCDDTDDTEPVVVDASTGSSTGAGTMTSPLDTVQAGVDQALQCAIVLAGTYNEAVSFNGVDILLTGVEGADSTIIDATGQVEAALTLESGETSATVVSGFTLLGDGHLDITSSSHACTSMYDCTEWYYSYCGGGVYVSGSDPTFTSIKAVGSTLSMVRTYEEDEQNVYYYTSFGGGMCFQDSTSSVSDSEVSSNYADQGGGVYVDETSNVSFSTTLVAANEATDGAGFEIEGGTLNGTNLITLFNDADEDGGGVLLIDGTATIINASHVGDEATNGGGLYAYDVSTLVLTNSIVNATVTGEGILVDSGAVFTGTYNDVYGNTGANYSGVTDPTGSDGNISDDPSLVAVTDDGNLNNDDLGLSSGSPCIDAGHPDSAYNDADGTQNDMGAYGGPGGDW